MIVTTPVRIAGSVFTAPAPRRLHVARRLAASGHGIHVDVIDASYPAGPGVDIALLDELRPEELAVTDVHVLTEDAEHTAQEAFERGARRSIVQVERLPGDSARTMRRLRKHADAAGAQLWLGIDVHTALAVVEPFSPLLDGVLLMLAPAGVSGQQADWQRLSAIRHLPTGLPVGVDGGIAPADGPRLTRAGVSEAVSGRALVGDVMRDL